MRDAVAALESAIAELNEAKTSLPQDLATEADAVIAKADALLQALRAKAEPA